MPRPQPEIDSFYHLARESIEGKVCSGTACFAARHLDPEKWHLAESSSPRLYCLGKCYCGPAASTDAARPNVEVHGREGIVLERIATGGASELEEYVRQGGYQALDGALTRPREELLDAITLSGLRGRGGAGFPTGIKWREVRRQVSPTKYVVANADEGDPGAFIDRFIMEDDPHCLIEGLTLAAYAVGASHGIVYVRKEYPAAASRLGGAIDDARGSGFLGARVFGHPFDFDIQLVSGKGAYVCGEETSLLNAIEGRRPDVRSRPPYPSERGLFGQPTLVNNVETLASVPWIARRGGEAYQALGFSSSRGTKVLCLNSLFTKPGLYEVEFGVTVRHIVDSLGGGLKAGTVKGLIIGGPLAGIVPPHLFDTPLGFEELRAIGASVGHGGVVVFDENTTILDLMLHVFSFGAYESCGKCTPCRLGARRIETMLANLRGRPAESVPPRSDIDEIVSALAATSLCGHGTGLADFASSAFRYYGKELDPCFV